jgi:hypothetical protein
MELDGVYLANLSTDALPALVRNFTNPQTAPAVSQPLGAVLACHIHKSSGEEEHPWQSYHPGAAAARMKLAGLDLSGYTVLQGRDGPVVEYGGKKILNCTSERIYD